MEAIITKGMSFWSAPGLVLSDYIITLILNVSGYTREQIINKCRKQEYVVTRQFVHYYLKKYTRLSLQQIGDLTGNDHTTVLHSVKTIESRMQFEPSFNQRYKAFIEIESSPEFNRMPDRILQYSEAALSLLHNLYQHTDHEKQKQYLVTAIESIQEYNNQIKISQPLTGFETLSGIKN